jgi:hypothetical protein
VLVLLAGLLAVLVAGCGGSGPSSRAAERAALSAGAARGEAAATQVVARRPVELVLPSGDRMRVEVSATAPDGSLELQPDITAAGWWEGGSRVGDPFGPVVSGYRDNIVVLARPTGPPLSGGISGPPDR